VLAQILRLICGRGNADGSIGGDGDMDIPFIPLPPTIDRLPDGGRANGGVLYDNDGIAIGMEGDGELIDDDVRNGAPTGRVIITAPVPVPVDDNGRTILIRDGDGVRIPTVAVVVVVVVVDMVTLISDALLRRPFSAR
jgi:hypothetical protein